MKLNTLTAIIFPLVARNDMNHFSTWIDCSRGNCTDTPRVGIAYNGPSDKMPHNIIPLRDFNEFYLEQQPEHTITFEFERLGPHANPRVGVSNKVFFGEGADIGAAFYGADLSNGNETLVKDFGFPIESGDTVRMTVKYFQDGSNAYINFEHNNLNLGRAFNLTSSVLPGFAPVVSFHGPGTVYISISTDSAIGEKRSVPYTTASGIWWLQSIAQSTHGTDGMGMTITEGRQRPNIMTLNYFNGNKNCRHLTDCPTATREWNPDDVCSVIRVPPFRRRSNITVVDTRNFIEQALDDPLSLLVHRRRTSTLELWKMGSLLAKWIRYGDPPPREFNGNPLASWEHRHADILHLMWNE